MLSITISPRQAPDKLWPCVFTRHYINSRCEAISGWDFLGHFECFPLINGNGFKTIQCKKIISKVVSSYIYGPGVWSIYDCDVSDDDIGDGDCVSELTMIYTENRESSWWQLCCHRWHCSLSNCPTLVPLVTLKLTSLQLSVFGITIPFLRVLKITSHITSIQPVAVFVWL